MGPGDPAALDQRDRLSAYTCTPGEFTLRESECAAPGSEEVYPRSYFLHADIQLPDRTVTTAVGSFGAPRVWRPLP